LQGRALRAGLLDVLRHPHFRAAPLADGPFVRMSNASLSAALRVTPRQIEA
jgi:hypothetical protein